MIKEIKRSVQERRAERLAVAKKLADMQREAREESQRPSHEEEDTRSIAEIIASMRAKLDAHEAGQAERSALGTRYVSKGRNGNVTNTEDSSVSPAEAIRLSMVLRLAPGKRREIGRYEPELTTNFIEEVGSARGTDPEITDWEYT